MSNFIGRGISRVFLSDLMLVVELPTTICSCKPESRNPAGVWNTSLTLTTLSKPASSTAPAAVSAYTSLFSNEMYPARLWLVSAAFQSGGKVREGWSSGRCCVCAQPVELLTEQCRLLLTLEKEIPEYPTYDPSSRMSCKWRCVSAHMPSLS